MSVKSTYLFAEPLIVIGVVAFIIVINIILNKKIDSFIDESIISKRVKNSSKAAIKNLIKVLFYIISLILILNITGLNYWLGATTIIGITGIFLGLTSQIWFPDLFSGLVLLFTQAIKEEDIVEIPELKIYGIVHRIGLFNTVIRNYVDNHKEIISNSKIKNATISNLSKPANVGGLREKLIFEIGYFDSENKRISPHKIREMFEEAFKRAEVFKYPITVDFSKNAEIFLASPEKYALKWYVFYYTQDIKNRLQNRYYLYEVFYKTSVEFNIGLETPDVVEITNLKESGEDTIFPK